MERPQQRYAVRRHEARGDLPFNLARTDESEVVIVPACFDFDIFKRIRRQKNNEKMEVARTTSVSTFQTDWAERWKPDPEVLGPIGFDIRIML